MITEGFEGNEVYIQIEAAAISEANRIADEIMASAKAKCPVGSITRDERKKFYWTQGKKWLPASGGAPWTEREPGTLRDSIRKVKLSDVPGNVRVYAGNFYAYYARFVEYGTAKMRARPFLRPAFQSKEGQALGRIESSIRDATLRAA